MTLGAWHSRYCLRLLPIAVALTIAATAVPIELRFPLMWDTRLGYRDIVGNLLLYAPLGIALRSRPLWMVLTVALLLSAVIEFTQIWSIERYASPIDVASNCVGAILAAWIWRRARRDGAAADAIGSSPVDVSWIVGAVIVSVAILAIWAQPIRSSALTNWNPDFKLLLGNEVTRNRPWEGEILEFAIVPSALSHDVTEIAHGVAGDIKSSRPLVLHDGDEIVFSHSASQAFARAAMRSNAFTVVARVSVANISQRGPARIVSFSLDPHRRNFDLGQQERQLVFRVRTPVSGLNGQLVRTESPPILRTGTDTLIIASYDGAVARIFVDGRLYSRSNLAAAGCMEPLLCDSVVPFVWAVMGASMTILALAIIPWNSRVQALGISLLATAAALILPRLLHIAQVPIATQAWTQWMALFGAVTIGFAATRQVVAMPCAPHKLASP